MGIRPILELPDPVLRQRAKKVRRVDSDLLRLAHDMVDTMQNANGMGLAANQVGELRRLIVIQVPEDDEARIYINPEIVHREGEREVEEGCLSIPGYRAMIKRSVWVRFGAMDHTEKVVKFKAEDILSQVLEHEVDHLNGILYIDHMEAHQKLIPVDSSDDEGDDGAADPDENEEHEAGPDTSNSNNSTAIWTPDDDSRETPASLKIK